MPNTSPEADTDAPPALDSMELDEIREGEINVKMLRSGRKVVVLKRGDDIRVYAELCPHMGADLSTATYCASAGTLSCKWHGYVFDADDGRLRENPNEHMLEPLRSPSKHYRPEKRPSYRLRRIPSEIRGSRVYFGSQGETTT